MQDEVISSGEQPSTIIIAGLGKEGESNYRYLKQRFPDALFILSDSKNPDQLDETWQAWSGEEKNRFITLNQLPEEQLDYSTTLLSKTPGIPAEHPALARLLNSGVHLTSNTACFYEEIVALPGVETIIVTGSKGKSTTASLIAHVLQQGSRPVFLAGNIGTPPLSVLDGVRLTQQEGKQPVVVLELSSHQLRESAVHPTIAVLLDITPEHLDYYPSFQAYCQAKAAITTRQSPADFLLFNPAHPIPAQIAETSHAKKVHFGEVSSYEAWYDAENLYVGEWRIPRSQSPLRGDHNAFNSLPALWIAKHYGESQAEVETALASFETLPHRLQSVSTVRGVEYINDSQGTTPEAAIAALQAFKDREVTLLVGGSDKGVSFEQLGQAIVHSAVKNLILFPPMGEKIKEAVLAANTSGANERSVPTFIPVESMQAAVQRAAEVTQQGGVVLLSPACASFGMFKNYQDRGDQFIEAVQAL